MKCLIHSCFLTFAAVCLVSVSAAADAPVPDSPHQPVKSRVDPDGTVHIPQMRIPFSRFASPQLRQAFIEQATGPSKFPAPTGRLDDPRVMEKMRRQTDEVLFEPVLERMKTIYPVDIEPKTLAGVRVEVITPKEGIAQRNRGRVLIGLHGGGFMTGGGAGGRVEAIPIASIGKIKVVAVDYRMWPEHEYPAATLDVVAVYKELLKIYKPENIGLFGCSSGGTLTAQSVAWFQTHDLPRPGAIGIFCEWGGGEIAGDSLYTAPVLNGLPPITEEALRAVESMPGYMAHADPNDPLAAPARHPAVLAKFPPTLLLSGTRAADMSAVINTHNQLVKLGVTAELHLWDGAWHGFAGARLVPEMEEANNVTVRFFDKNLGGRPEGCSR